MTGKSSKDELRATIEDLVWQFAYQAVRDGVPCLSTGGLSALEGAFAVLGYDDPHPVPELVCDVSGCTAWATSGTPTPDGYQRLCGEHYREVEGYAMTAKPKAQQDDLAGPCTKAMRQSMVAIDKIASQDDLDWRERDAALLRIQRYALTVRDDMRHTAEAASALSWEATLPPYRKP